MTNTLRYLTHPQVRIDSAVPVPKWGLSDIGRERALSFAAAGILNSTKIIVSSAETKAIETAEIISDVIKTPIKIVENTHENDRSATGFLESAEFESVAGNVQLMRNPALSEKQRQSICCALLEIDRKFDALSR